MGVVTWTCFVFEKVQVCKSKCPTMQKKCMRAVGWTGLVQWAFFWFNLKTFETLFQNFFFFLIFEYSSQPPSSKFGVRVRIRLYCTNLFCNFQVLTNNVYNDATKLKNVCFLNFQVLTNQEQFDSSMPKERSWTDQNFW